MYQNVFPFIMLMGKKTCHMVSGHQAVHQLMKEKSVIFSNQEAAGTNMDTSCGDSTLAASIAHVGRVFFGMRSYQYSHCYCIAVAWKCLNFGHSAIAKSFPN
jgi:hypothetical protein